MKYLFFFVVIIIFLTATLETAGQTVTFLTPAGANIVPDSLFGVPIILSKVGWQTGVDPVTGCAWKRYGITVTPVTLTPKKVEVEERPTDTIESIATVPIIINFKKTEINLEVKSIPVPQDTSWARNSVGVVVSYVGALGGKNDNLKGGFVFETQNIFVSKKDASQPWNQKFFQVDASLALLGGSRPVIPEVLCDTCFVLIREEKDRQLVVQAQPTARLRVGKKNIQPFLAGSIPLMWSRDEFEVIPMASSGVVFSLPPSRNGKKSNFVPRIEVSAVYSKYGVSGNISAFFLFGSGGK